MEEHENERLQGLVRKVFLLDEVPYGIVLRQHGVQVEGEVGLVELLLQVRQGVVRRAVVQKSYPPGDHEQHLAQAVYLSEYKVFHKKGVFAIITK